VFNATGPASRMTIADLVYGCKAVTTGDATVTWVDEAFLTEQNVRPWGDLPCWLPTTSEVAGFNTVDSSKAIAAGMTFRCLADTAADTLAWYHTLDPERRPRVMGGLSPERETELLAAWAAGRAD
jgi:2'-hydroxyisoflavone reductase